MKVLSEKETREKLLNAAFNLGGEMTKKGIQAIFDKWDRAMKNCTNEQERKMMAHAAGSEIQKYFDFGGALVMDGVEVVPARNDFIDVQNNGNKIIKA